MNRVSRLNLVSFEDRFVGFTCCCDAINLMVLEFYRIFRLARIDVSMMGMLIGFLFCYGAGPSTAQAADRAGLPVLPAAPIRAARPGDLPLPQDGRLQSAAQHRTRRRRRQSTTRSTEFYRV